MPCKKGRARRAFTLLVSSCLVACSVLPRSCGNEPPPAPSAARPPIASPGIAEKEKLPLDPFQRRAALDAAYRLKPDRRILLAVAAVQRFFTPGASGAATATPEGEGWRIRLGPADVGALPELPDFPQALSFLDGFAKRLALEHPVPGAAPAGDASVDPFDWEPDAIAALREAQSRWLKGERSPELVRRACRALASLAFQDLDSLGVGEKLPAQALAMLAVSRALGVEAPREEALTAGALGYTTAARSAAARLPEGDALRLYLERSDKLEARATGGSVAARYLQLRALRWADDEEGETRWMETQMAGARDQLPVLALLLRGRHGWRSPIAEEMPARVLLAAAEQAGDPRVQAKPAGGAPVGIEALGFREGSLLTTASELIGRVDSSANGPLYDAEVLQSYDRSMLYSALSEWSSTLLDRLSSPEATQDFMRMVGQDRAPEARDFQRWLLLRVAARLPEPTPAAPAAPSNPLSRELERLLFADQPAQAPRSLRQQLLDGLSQMPGLGPEAPLRLFEEIRARLDWADPAALTATRALAARLDGRTDHRVRFALIVWESLYDLALVDRLMLSALGDSRDAHRYTARWYAEEDGDDGFLEDLVRSPAVPFDARVDAVSALGRMGKLSPVQLEEQLDKLGASRPLSRKPTKTLVDLLMERKQYERAERVVRKWLTNNASRQDLDVAIMHATLGRVLYKQGRYEEAWKAVQPFLPSWQGTVMLMAADVATARGRPDEARRILGNVMERYPEAQSVARSFWLLRDYEAAAQSLAHLPKRPSPTEWAWKIGRDFAEVLGPLPADESRKAAAALQKGGFGPMEISSLADALSTAGFHEQAFAISAPLIDQNPGLRTAPPLIVRAYFYLRKWKGEEEAVKWLRAGPLLTYATPSLPLLVYDLQAFDLLWDLLPEPAGRRVDGFWLLRTASLLRDPKLATAERKNALREHYKGGGQTHYHELGKMLLGQLDEREAAKLATDAEKACEVSYYLGLKAESEGRLSDATAWYRNAVESAEPRWTEYDWSYNALQRFQSSGKTLRRLGAERAASARKD